MASVSWRKLVTNNPAAKILSLVIAAIFWLTVTVEKETVKSCTMPVRMVNIPQGLAVAGNPPRNIDVTVAGPALMFFAHQVPCSPVTLDLRNTAKGAVAFPDLAKFISVPDGVSVIRVFPSRLELELVKR